MPKIYESPDKGNTFTEREFTLQVPPPPKELLEKWSNSTYESNRRDRLVDVVGDYLTDDECDPRRFYEELIAEVQSWIDYHQKNVDKANELKQLLLGERNP